MTGRAAAFLAAALLLTSANAVAQHTRLFRPEDLGQLEGPDRELWQRPEQIMDSLFIGEGSTVADLGAGGGWFTIRLARRVGPNGKVYAEDVQSQMIHAIDGRVRGEGLHNVETVLGTQPDPRLPTNTLDAVLIVDAYREMEQPITLLRNVAHALKPSGLIGIVDFTKEGSGPGPTLEERVDPDRVIHDAESAGLELRRREGFLRYQYLLIFGLPSR